MTTAVILASYIIVFALGLCVANLVSAARHRRVLDSLRQTASDALGSTRESAYAKGLQDGLIWHREDEIRMPMATRLNVQKTTAFYFTTVLNNGLAIDKPGFQALFETHIATTMDMLQHPTWPVQLRADEKNLDKSYVTLSPIGLVNALIPKERQRYRVASLYKPTGELEKFVVFDIEKNEVVADEHLAIDIQPGAAGDAGADGL
jgi:hypothetical protein